LYQAYSLQFSDSAYITDRLTCDRVFSLWNGYSHTARWSAVWIWLWRRMAFRLLRVRFAKLISIL